MTHALTALLTGLMMVGLVWLSNRPPAITGDAIVLRYPLPLRAIFLVAGTGFPALCAYLWVGVVNGTVRQGLMLTAVISVVFLPLALYSLMQLRVVLQIDRDGIGGRTAFQGRRRILWEEIASVDYSRAYSSLRLRDRAGETIRVSRLLRGHQAVWTALEGKVDPNIWRAAAAAFQADRILWPGG